MNEPVSSPSLLTITAPSKETPAKPPRVAPDDFREQLSSHSKTDKTRPSVTKEKGTKFEKSSDITTNEKQVRPETEQEATSPGEAVSSASQEDIVTTPKDEAIELPESEEVLETLAEGLVVVAPIIVSSTKEELGVSEELLPGETIEETVAVTSDAPVKTTAQATELLEVDSDLEPTVGNTVEGNTLEAINPETIAASAEIATKKPNEQELATPVATLGVEESTTASAAPVSTTNDQNSGEKQEEKTPNDPSLLNKLNKAAIQRDGQETSEVELPVEKPGVSSSPPPIATTAVAAAENTLPSEGNRDTQDDTGRPTAISGAEERSNQRAELAAAAKTRTNTAPSIDPSRFVSRVAKAFEAAQQQGGGPIRLRLSPPELGILQVQIEVKEGVLTASLEAETHKARILLLENLPALRDRLAEQQIRVEKFDVDVRDESTGPNYEQTDSQQSDADTQGNRQNRQRTTNNPRALTNQETVENLTKPSTISFDNDRVDLVA